MQVSYKKIIANFFTKISQITKSLQGEKREVLSLQMNDIKEWTLLGNISTI